MKYKVLVTQYFDTYPEWTRVFGEANAMAEARELETKARYQFENRPLVSYSFRIEEITK